MKPNELIGRRIKKIRWMTEGELKSQGWRAQKVVVLELNDGTLIFGENLRERQELLRAFLFGLNIDDESMMNRRASRYSGRRTRKATLAAHCSGTTRTVTSTSRLGSKP
jgi:hypothetical protein